MKVVIEKVFPLASTADNAWVCLQNIEAVAGCMPGARITERIDATHYKGTVTVRVGPATMSFKGVIEVLALDPTLRSLHLVGKGSDTTGTSGASMDLVASVMATGETCKLTGKSEVSMSGKAAAFGGRVMNTVADQILKQFVVNFAELAQSANAQQASPEPVEPVPDAQVGVEADGAGAGATTVAAEAVQPPAPAPVRRPPAAAELNGLALAWAVIRDWLRGLFSRRTV